MQTLTPPEEEAKFHSLAGAPGRRPRPRLWITWDGINRVNETDNLYSFSINTTLASFGSGNLAPMGTSDVGSLTLYNTNGRFTPYNAEVDDTELHEILSGPQGMHGIRFNIEMIFDPIGETFTTAWCPVFTGYLYNESYDPLTNLVTISFRDIGWVGLQNRLSSEVRSDTDGSERGLRNHRGEEWRNTPDDIIMWYAQLGNIPNVLSDNLASSPFSIPIAWLDEDSVLSDMQEIAQASGGWLFSDNQGQIHFQTPDSWIGRESVHTFDGDNFSVIPYSRPPNDLASTVTVEYSPRVRTSPDELFELDELYTIEPATSGPVSKEITFKLDHPAIVSTENFIAGDDYWFRNAGGINMNRYRNDGSERGAGAWIDGGEIVAKAQTVTVTLRNNHPTAGATLSYLRLTGISIQGGPSGTVERKTQLDGVVGFPERSRGIRGNFYLQTESMSSWIADILKDRSGQLIPAYQINGVFGLPWLELTDRITFRDRNSVSEWKDGFIIGITTNFTQTDYTQDYVVADADYWFESGVNYFIIQQTALDGGVAYY